MTAVAAHARIVSSQRSACHVCDHGRTGVCLCPAVRGNQPNVSFEDARRRHGPCGPEAIHMDFPGLYWPGDKR
jgi:hypothetical protein